MEKNTENQSKGFVGNVVGKTKSFALNANEMALNKTEEIVSQSLDIAGQWQAVAEKAIKGGLKLSSNQQDLVFDILNEVKADIKEGKKRFNVLMA